MFIPFEKLSPQSRIWIYQANRKLNSIEEKTIATSLADFCGKWNAHGEPLKSSFRIEKNQFVIMAVDEDFHNPSGCSIDSSVGVMRQIQAATGVDLLDRSKVPFYIDGNIELIPLSELKSNFTSSRLQASTVTFNTMAATKAEMEEKWEILVEKSWMAKYLPKTALIS